MTRGIRAAKPGKSAASTNPQDQLYSSEFISPKVFLKKTGTITTNAGGDATLFIDHKLSYSPVVLLYINPTISIVNDSFSTVNAWGLADNNFVYVSSNPQKIRIDIQDTDANTSYKYVCFIFVEPANE